MGVYICGMEMPKNCDECPMFNLDIDGGCYCTKYFVIRKKDQDRPDWCPLVPVPPHGRLIDGDVAEAICFTNEDADGKDFYDGILYAAEFIRQQPTIIEAEEDDT